MAARLTVNLPGLVSVKAFGAKGDGVTDDTAAIQNAINSVSSGGGVLFPAENFLVDYLTIAANSISLVGIAGATITKKISGTEGPLLYSTGYSDLVFQGLILNGQGQSQTYWNPDAYTNATNGDNIQLVNCARARILNVRTRQSARAGIQLFGCPDCLLDGVWGDNNGYGTISIYRQTPSNFSSQGSNGTRVIGCRADSDYCDGIRVVSDAVTVNGCISNNARLGTTYGAPDNYAGFYLESCRGVVVSGCYATGNSNRGIDLNNSTGGSYSPTGTADCSIVGNVIVDHANGGIYLGTSRIVVVGNACNNNGGTDILVAGRGSGHIVGNNSGVQV